MQSDKKGRLSETVREAIQQIISEEGLKPGDKLYSENQLSKRLGVSRSSIREAVRMLEASGFVEVHQGKGIFLTDRPEHASSLIEWVVSNVGLLKEHFEIRLQLEPYAAAMAARKVDGEGLLKLEEAFHDFCTQVEEGNTPEAITRDSAFHLAISEMAHNRTLSVLMGTMAESLNEGWIASLNTPGRLSRTVAEHGAILEAVRDHDAAAAAEAMRVHLSNAIDDIEEYAVSV